MDAAELFRASLPLIDRVAHALCRRSRMTHADAEDFASSARIALMEDDYRVLRAFEGRSSLHTYLTVILQRLLADERMRTAGRWHPSAAAQKQGTAGVLLETLIHREGRSLDEALPAVQAVDAAITRSAAEAMAAKFPQRAAKPRLVAVDEVEVILSAPDRADASALDAERRQIVDRTSHIVRQAIDALAIEDRTVVRFHFGNGMSIADIARMLRLPQRPLYRRLEASLRRVREELVKAGIDAGSINEVVGAATTEMDFGFDSGKNAPARQTTMEESP